MSRGESAQDPRTVERGLPTATPFLRFPRHVFRRHRSQPVQWVVERINPILRGWVNYFYRTAAFPRFGGYSVDVIYPWWVLYTP
jgi:Group II intron, maturase-specific domain